VQTKVSGLCAPGLEAWSLEPINAHPLMGICYSVGLTTKVSGLCSPGLEAWSLEPINAHPLMGIWYWQPKFQDFAHQAWKPGAWNLSTHSQWYVCRALHQAWVRLSGGWCRRRSAGFEACSAQFGWIRIFGVLRPHKICEILEHAGREARSDERRQSSSDRCTPKVLKAMFDILIVSFLFECQRFCFSWSWVVWGLLKPIEPVKNAGNTHSKKSLALLLRVRLCSFCFNQLICTFEAIVNICHELMSRRQGCDSEISAQHAFSIFFYWIWAHMFTLLLWRLQVFCTWSNVEVLLGCVPRVETYS
jgi:hypothetical protein